MLAGGDRDRGIKAGAVREIDAYAVHIDTHRGDGMSGGRRGNKMDRRGNAGGAGRLDCDAGKRCGNQQQHDNTQVRNVL